MVVGAFTVVRVTVVVGRAVGGAVVAAVDDRPVFTAVVEPAGAGARAVEGAVVGVVGVVEPGSATDGAGQVNGTGGVAVVSAADERPTTPGGAGWSPAATGASGLPGDAAPSTAATPPGPGSGPSARGSDDFAVTEANDGFITAKMSARTCAPSSKQFR